MSDSLSVKDVLSQATSKSDVATILLAGTAGFIADAALGFGDVFSPGIAGCLSVCGALGIKRAWESVVERRLERLKRTISEEMALEQAATDHRKVQSQWRDLFDLLMQYQENDLADRLMRDLSLFRRDLITSDDLQSGLNDVVAEFRSRRVRVDRLSARAEEA